MDSQPNLYDIVMKNGPLSFERAAQYIEDVAGQLNDIHMSFAFHGDVRPTFMVLDDSGIAKLIDSSITSLIGSSEVSFKIDENELALGVADYLAPERALNGHRVDGKSDIYSLGRTFYFLLAGHPPFPFGSISERLLRHQVDTPESLHGFRKDVPKQLTAICEKMMAKKPEDRYQTASSIVSAIAAWRSDTS